ncbi:uncharacterized protein LOC130109147 [Lampris incognitus]|uniref:uncharacterized protein LOC130109147 n=1 Tax=Lampris incognitus TaxID=2546036 RepID=UPI0024B50195|nr:uncharacterized protein LOC130109147 [Lampris incognitus]
MQGPLSVQADHVETTLLSSSGGANSPATACMGPALCCFLGPVQNQGKLQPLKVSSSLGDAAQTDTHRDDPLLQHTAGCGASSSSSSSTICRSPLWEVSETLLRDQRYGDQHVTSWVSAPPSAACFVSAAPWLCASGAVCWSRFAGRHLLTRRASGGPTPSREQAREHPFENKPSSSWWTPSLPKLPSFPSPPFRIPFTSWGGNPETPAQSDELTTTATQTTKTNRSVAGPFRLRGRERFCHATHYLDSGVPQRRDRDRGRIASCGDIEFSAQ